MFKTVGVIVFFTALFRYVLVRGTKEIREQEDYIDKELRDLEERHK